MTVTFCGHSSIMGDKTIIEKNVHDAVYQLMYSGAKTFLLGGYGEFDHLCAKIVYELKQQFSNVESVLMIPYLTKKYDTRLYDRTEYPPLENVPLRFAISKRNKFMVDYADIVISHVIWGGGRSSKTYECAVRKNKKIITIDDGQIKHFVK